MLPLDEAGLETLLRERAPGPPTPPDSAPWEFLLREDPEAAWPLVSRLLVDADPVVRLRALEFVMTWRDERTLPRLVEVVRAHADLFAEQVVDGTRLRERLQHALANQCGGRDGAALTPLLLGLLDGGPPSPATASPIAAQDPLRAAQMAARLGGSSDEQQWIRGAAAAVALYRRDELLQFCSALTARPPDERERLAAEVERAIERDDERARKIAGKRGLEGPRRPAPSSAEIRTALAV